MQAGIRAETAGEAVVERRELLDDAKAALDAARAGASPASFAPPAGALFGTASYAGGYVFPVGGGPSVVSVSELHHDYPAADIAAPMGTPLYALADGVVEDAWPLGSGNCGIGFVLGTAGRPQLDVLPPLVPRARRPAGRVARGGSAGRPRRLHGPLDRPAPAPPDRAGADLPAAGSVVPLLRRHRVRVAGIGRDAAAPGRAGFGRARLRRGRPAGLRGRRRRRSHRVLPRLLSLTRVLPTRE